MIKTSMLQTMTTDKSRAYARLVLQRKGCRLCSGLTNPSVCEDGKYDSDQIGPWTLWQGNLDADVMVVGQDWGDTNYFRKWKGIDQPSGNRTNENLRCLIQVLEIDIKGPREPRDQNVFLTNLILCLKEGGLQAPIDDKWLSNCANTFFLQLADVIRPKIILALGKNVSQAILHMYGIGFRKSWTLTNLMAKGPYCLFGSTYVFPLYHCGAGSVNRNRSFENQLIDWQHVVRWLQASEIMGPVYD